MKVIPNLSLFVLFFSSFLFVVVARLAAAARVHATPSVPITQPVQPASMPEVAKKEEPKVPESEKAEPAKETKEKEEVKVPKDKSRPVSSTPVPGTPWYDWF
jgi:transcription elongation regulator 1